MRFRAVVSAFVAVVLVSGCSLPFRSSAEERKAPCDRLAAQAIETASLQDAESHAIEAARCYAAARN